MGLKRGPMWRAAVSVALVAALQVCAQQVPESNFNVKIVPAKGSQTVSQADMPVDADVDHVAVALKVITGAEVVLYKKVSAQQWDLVLTVVHPDADPNLGEHVALDARQKWLFSSAVYDFIDDSPDDTSSYDRHVLFWQYKIADDGTYSAGDPIRIDIQNDINRLGASLSIYDSTLLVGGWDGFEVWSLEDPQNPTLIQTEVFGNDLLPDFKHDFGRYRTEECEHNDQFVVCGIGNEHKNPSDPLYDDNLPEDFPEAYKLQPYVVIWAKNEDSGNYEYFERYGFWELYPDLNRYPTTPALGVGLDKENNILAVGFPEASENGWVDPPSTNMELSGGRVHIFEYDGATWGTNSQDVPLDDAELPGPVEDWGFAVSCEGGVCLASPFNVAETFEDENGNERTAFFDAAYTIERNDEGVWGITIRLRGDGIENFAYELQLHNGTAIVAGNKEFFVYDSIVEVNTESVTQIEDAFCFAADSPVVTRRSGVVETRPMEQLALGDEVLSVDEHGAVAFSEVYLVEHSQDNQLYKMLYIDYQRNDGTSDRLAVTTNHLLAVGMENGKFAYDVAKTVSVGSEVFVVDGTGSLARARVTAVGEGRDRIRNVLTMNGGIVVSGVAASCYTRLFRWPAPRHWPVAGALLAWPLKFLYSLELHSVASALRSVAGRLMSTT